MSVVAFVSADFKAQYPEFAAVSDPALTGYFSRACNFLNNTDFSIVENIAERTTLLYLATAHIAALTARGSLVVGNVTAGAKGSVNSSFSSFQPGSGQWWEQTQYGAEFWFATIEYRSFLYV